MGSHAIVTVLRPPAAPEPVGWARLSNVKVASVMAGLGQSYANVGRPQFSFSQSPPQARRTSGRCLPYCLSQGLCLSQASLFTASEQRLSICLSSSVFLWRLFILVDLQCSVNFCCTAKWPGFTCFYTGFFSYYQLSSSTTSDWIEFPVLYSRTSLLLDSRCHSLHLLTSNSRSNALPLPPPRQPQLCSPVYETVSILWLGSSVPYLRFHV